jgi:hypothetical protein
MRDLAEVILFVGLAQPPANRCPINGMMDRLGRCLAPLLGTICRHFLWALATVRRHSGPKIAQKFKSSQSIGIDRLSRAPASAYFPRRRKPSCPQILIRNLPSEWCPTNEWL